MTQSPTREAQQLSAKYGIPPTTAHKVLRMVSSGYEQGSAPAAVLAALMASRIIDDQVKAEAVLKAAAAALGLAYTTGREV